MYAKMPFGLMNAWATFQRAMGIAFAEENDNFVVIHMDDITIFSKYGRDHNEAFGESVFKVQEIWYFP